MVARLPTVVFAAALLLFGQLAASAHSHPNQLARAASRQAELTIPVPPCALCLLAFHSPASASPLPAFESPEPAVDVPQAAASPGYRWIDFSSSLTRAPPASV
jgi:hypothetical protein